MYTTAKVDKVTIDAEVKTLLALKEEFKTLTGKEWKPGTQAEKTPTQSSTNLHATSCSTEKEADLLKRIAEQGDKVRQLKTG